MRELAQTCSKCVIFYTRLDKDLNIMYLAKMNTTYSILSYRYKPSVRTNVNNVKSMCITYDHFN